MESFVFFLHIHNKRALGPLQSPLVSNPYSTKTDPAIRGHDIDTSKYNLFFPLCMTMAFVNDCFMVLAPGGLWMTVGEPSPWELLEEEFSRQ